MRLVSLAALVLLAACSTASVPRAASGLRHTASVGRLARFTLATTPALPGAPACVSGNLAVTPNPMSVTYGGSQVVRISPCNAANGDRMGAYITTAWGCGSTADTVLGTLGDGGSATNGTNVAVISGYTPCAGDVLTVNDLTTGATADIPISIVY